MVWEPLPYIKKCKRAKNPQQPKLCVDRDSVKQEIRRNGFQTLCVLSNCAIEDSVSSFERYKTRISGVGTN